MTRGVPHGWTRYHHPVHKCRCRVCRYEHSAYRANMVAQQKAGTWQPWTDAAEVIEHLRHLRSQGLGTRTIAETAGVSRAWVHWVSRGVHRDGSPVTRVMTPKAKAVLAIPRYDLDEVVVQRLVSGARCPGANREEKLEAVRRLHEQGCTDGEIGDRLHMHNRQVFRYRSEALNLPAIPQYRNPLPQPYGDVSGF